MQPTVGRIVHFHRDTAGNADLGIPAEKFAPGESAREEAALIIAVNADGTINLNVWNAHGSQRFERNVEQSDDSPGWRWPPRV